MGLGDRIRNCQELHKKNLQAIISSQDLIMQQLARLRALHENRSQQKEISPPGNQEATVLGGEVRTNAAGSFLHFETCVSSSETEPKTSCGKVVISSLLEWLLLSTDNRQPGEVVFLDTETTGLTGGTGTCAFLIGLGTWQPGGFRTEQFLMRDFNEEQAILLALEKRLASVQVVVTFNGKSFDLPLLESRFVLARRNWVLSQAIHLDLVHPARRLWKLLLGDCSLGNLERQILGILRENDVPGSLIPSLYFNYIRTGIPRGIKAILEHNRQDIKTLADLTQRVSGVLTGRLDSSLLAAEELISAGKYCKAMGRKQESLQFSQSALARELPADLRCEALIRSAEVLKAQRSYAKAVGLWEAVIADSPGFPYEAFLNLAIHYEHREKQFGKALELTLRALFLVSQHGGEDWRTRQLLEWEHRRKRLQRKLANQSSSEIRETAIRIE